jgi:hypothetical protein
MFKVVSGNNRDDDSPYICVSIIAAPFWYYLTGALAFVAAMAVLA